MPIPDGAGRHGPQRRLAALAVDGGERLRWWGLGHGVTHPPHGRRNVLGRRPVKSEQETTGGVRGTRASANGPLATQAASNTPSNTTRDTQSYGATTRHVGRCTWQDRESFSMRGPLLSWQLALPAHTQLNW